MEIKLINLYRALLLDLGVSKKDVSYLTHRLRNEGFHVLTALLPAFSKHVLACIEKGYYTVFEYGGGCPFRTRKSGGLPGIFQGFLKEIFCFNDYTKVWRVSDSACPVSIWALRQACEYAYKLALPFTDAQLAMAERKFWEVDDQVHTKQNFDELYVDTLRKNFQTYYPHSFRITPADCHESARNGPGTFAEKRQWEKSTGVPWWVRNYLPIELPYEARNYEYAYRLNKRWPLPRILGRVDRRVSEVLFVPKDSRGPRVIVREPYETLQVQMGYNTQMSRALERDTNYRINFESQETNRQLAHQSSITRQNATLDLKDASDRVSFAIVQRLMQYHPLKDLVANYRTAFGRVPGARLDPKPRKLKKLAGMGSGFTFPTMALLIHLAICTSVSRGFDLSYRSVMERVYVYGDDIIVPNSWVELAISGLQRVGLEVNSSKSYSKSYFRESCGGDYYYGNDVTPVRLRLHNSEPTAHGTTLSLNQRDFGIVALERHARELCDKQLHSASAFIYNILEQALGPLPRVSGDSPYLGRYTTASEVHSSLECDETGAYTRVSAYLPVPRVVRLNSVVKNSLLNRCPQRYLKQALTKVDKPFEDRQVLLGFDDGVIPRKISLRRTLPSGLALVG